MTIADIMQTAPVIPVIMVDEVEQAEPLAQALVAGGLRVLEVTLRTPAALEAIRIMRGVEGAIVGAGTVTNQRELADAIDAGSDFIVSPGLTSLWAKRQSARASSFFPASPMPVTSCAGSISGLPISVFPTCGGRLARAEGAGCAFRPVPFRPISTA